MPPTTMPPLKAISSSARLNTLPCSPGREGADDEQRREGRRGDRQEEHDPEQHEDPADDGMLTDIPEALDEVADVALRQVGARCAAWGPGSWRAGRWPIAAVTGR